jgi:hypothetical protein
MESHHRSRSECLSDILAEQGQNTLVVRGDPLETRIIRYRTKFCIQYNQLECQYTTKSEYQRDKMTIIKEENLELMSTTFILKELSLVSKIILNLEKFVQ